MKALVYPKIGEAHIDVVADPKPAADEILIAVSSTGVCHTDLDILHGRYLSSFPVIPGHEVAGTVIEVGADVTAHAVGDRVAIDPLLPCGACAACRANRPSLCENLKAYGATSNGGFAPKLAVKATNAHSIMGLPFHVGALAEPFACVLHGIDRVNVSKATQAVIFGAGPIGLMMMMGLQARGIARVTMIDLEETRLERAIDLGADVVILGKDLQATSLPERFDLVVDCTGVASVCERMPEFAKDGATLLFFGVCPPDALARFSPFEIFRRELTLVGSHSLSFNLPDAIETLIQLGARAEKLVSHRLPLEDIAAQMLSPPKKGTMKIQYDATV
jgi:D-altritol 5-dehydrogenase